MRNRIKTLRKNRGLTQQELAIKVGITRPYLSDIERNISQPGTSIAIKIAKELLVSVEEIFFDDTVHHAEHDKTA